MGNTIAFKPRNAIVDELIPESDDPNRAIKAKLLDQHVPAIMKRGYEKARAELEPSMKAGAAAACEQVVQAHSKELERTNHDWRERAHHMRSAARGMWLAIGLGLGAAAGGTAGVLVTKQVMNEGMFGVVAASRSASEVWTPPQGPTVRDVPRCENVADCEALR